MADGVCALANDLEVTHLAMDGAYSKNQSFLLECRRQGLQTAFKPNKYQRGRTSLRPGVDTTDGMPYSSLTPVQLVRDGQPPAQSDGTDIDVFIAWRHSIHQYGNDGTIRLRDPFAGGRLRCELFEASMRNGHDTPLVHVDPTDVEDYRPGTVTVGADELPLMQMTAPGSIAHDLVYGTRNQVENVNGQLRSFTDLGPRYHPSFSLVRRCLFHAALVAGHNIRELDRWRLEQCPGGRETSDSADGSIVRKRRPDATRSWADHDRENGRPFAPSESGLDPPIR